MLMLQGYLLSKALRVLQTVCEGLGENIDATFTEFTVLSTLLPGVGQQSPPHLGH